ncbi:hypothetical protein HYX08_01505 [Candidatus Woesearchaeota archaeon]|nr:hypothetical protein [Candidatus Woesearchaeota archaeon]
MTIDKRVAAFFSSLALASSLGFAKMAKAEEINPNGWPIPSIAGATLLETKTRRDIIEGVNIPVIQRVYRTAQGTYFNTLSITTKNGQEKIWAYYVDIDGKPPMEYGLVDIEGDGKFTHKYGTNERMTNPAYVSTEQISKK